MAISQLTSRAQLGIEAPTVRVETHLGPGLPGFNIVGLPETAVKESRDRVRSAIVNSGFRFPEGRLTVNLAPADLPKHGGRFDLPIALGILIASRQLPQRPDGEELIGELALSGELRPVTGVLPASLACARGESGRLIVPQANAAEAALCRATEVRAADCLLDVCAHWKGERMLAQVLPAETPAAPRVRGPCLSQVRGQWQGRRALEIAASGGHSLLLCGPPGSGKSMLASRLPSLLPALDEQQALEVAAVHSLHRPRPAARFRLPPFRSPHHTASAVALVGGGNQPRPGEISLAHHGVLFLDELPEFDRRVLDVLREPLETGEVHISRAARQAVFPARFQLVVAMNPCPCGWLGDPARGCGYDCEKARRYQARVSGPFMDRIDLQLELPPVKPSELMALEGGETSDTVRERVLAARERQYRRQGCLNRDLSVDDLKPVIDVHRTWLVKAMETLGVSARSLHRIARVARTLADMEDASEVAAAHLQEALGYRIGHA